MVITKMYDVERKGQLFTLLALRSSGLIEGNSENLSGLRVQTGPS